MSRRITRLYGKKTDRHVSNDGKTRPLKNYLRILGMKRIFAVAHYRPNQTLINHIFKELFGCAA
jgi:hypothetical protein